MNENRIKCLFQEGNLNEAMNLFGSGKKKKRGGGMLSYNKNAVIDDLVKNA